MIRKPAFATLSLTLVSELETALETAPGAVVIASHDRWLR